MTSARAFSSRLADLLRNERVAFADFLVALADFDRLGLWRDLGHVSLFYFLHRELGLSKGAAHYRKVAAGLVQRFPEIIEPLRDGRLCITSIVELAKVITPENRTEVVPQFFHCSKQEAKEVSAAIDPIEAVPRREVVTAAGAADGAAPAELALPKPAPGGTLVRPGEPVHPDETPAPAARHRAPQPATVEPVSADLRRLHVTVSKRFLEKLDSARNALAHTHPGAGTEQILELALDLLLDRHARRKGMVARPLPTPRPTTTDEIPAHVRRAVWARDGGCCQWRMVSGGVCGSRKQVQFDHIEPRALGGESTKENVRLLCRAHDLEAARRVFGDRWMDRFTWVKRSHAANDLTSSSVGSADQVLAAPEEGPAANTPGG
jgi:hypothetical protein